MVCDFFNGKIVFDREWKIIQYLHKLDDNCGIALGIAAMKVF